tara:strand:+ start:38 stop:253 length:216 start_codon:yes stop_codon:yes gene_type:complete
MNDTYSATLLFPDGHLEVWEHIVYNYADARTVHLYLELFRLNGVKIVDQTNDKLLYIPNILSSYKLRGILK